MKNYLITILLLCSCACAYAQSIFGEEANNPFANQNNQNVQNAQQATPSGSAYSSTVYQPFSSTTPSEYSPGESESSSPSRVSGMHRGFVDRPDTNKSESSPVGEPWVMLVFAAVAIGVIAYKRKKEPSPAKN